MTEERLHKSTPDVSTLAARLASHRRPGMRLIAMVAVGGVWGGGAGWGRGARRDLDKRRWHHVVQRTADDTESLWQDAFMSRDFWAVREACFAARVAQRAETPPAAPRNNP